MYLTDKPSHGRPVLYPASHEPLSYHTMGHGYNTRRIPGGERHKEHMNNPRLISNIVLA